MTNQVTDLDSSWTTPSLQALVTLITELQKTISILTAKLESYEIYDEK